MCRGVWFGKKFAGSQGELAKLAGNGDWKRGKSIIVDSAGNDYDFEFSSCLCPIDGDHLNKIALSMDCVVDKDDSFNYYFDKVER